MVTCMFALVSVTLAGCSNLTSPGTGPVGGNNSGGGMMGDGNTTAPQGSNSDGMMGSGVNPDATSSVGERIWLTGVGTDGQEIAHTAPQVSQGALMMGGGGCASCHAADGRGGAIRMMTGTAIEAPDVTYDALIKVGFTDTTLRRAITDGLDENGKELDVAMPRWQMGTADLDATIAYLKVLGAR